MVKAYLSLGSNLGDKRQNLLTALKLLEKESLIKIIRISSFYETEPVGYQNQDWFLNIVVKIDTTLQPYELLAFCQDVEERLQRKRTLRWGPRTIDLDILIYENFTSTDTKLTIPHPRMKERAFVLVPLEEIEPDLVLEGRSIAEMIGKLKGEIVKRID